MSEVITAVQTATMPDSVGVGIVDDVGETAVQVCTPASNSVESLLTAQKRNEVAERARQTEVKTMSLRDISMIGAEADAGLNKALSGFMDRINRADSPRLFNLVSTFNEAVAKEDIPKLAQKVLDEKLPLFDRIIGFFSRKKLNALKNKFLENTRQVISAKSVTLTSVIGKMEDELAEEQKLLEEELRNLDKLQDVYFQQYHHFVESTFFAQSVLQAAKAADTAGWDQHQLRVWGEKLQALESRALAMEGVLTRLPADALVVAQLQNAGILTLQETTTTAASRFSSIKMTLITLNSTLVTKSVQQLSEQSAALDKNLLDVRSRLMKGVVGEAASAPGRNRMDQAAQLQRIVADTQELMKIVDAAKATNKAQFELARSIFGDSRKAIAELGAQISISKLD